MDYSLNPFKLYRQLKEYADICNKQCVSLNEANAQIAELISENGHKDRMIKRLETDIVIANNQIKASEIISSRINKKER